MKDTPCIICNENTNEDDICEGCRLIKERLIMFKKSGQSREEAWDSTFDFHLPYRTAVKLWDYAWGTTTIETEDTEIVTILKLLDRTDVIEIAQAIKDNQKIKAINIVRNTTGLKLKRAWFFINRWMPHGERDEESMAKASDSFKKQWAKANR